MKTTLDLIKPIFDLNFEAKSFTNNFTFFKWIFYRLNNDLDTEFQTFFFNENNLSEELFPDFSIKNFSFVAIPGPKLMNLEWRIYFNKQIFDSTIVKKILDNESIMKINKNSNGLKFRHVHEHRWYPNIFFHLIYLKKLGVAGCQILKLSRW